MDFGVQGNNQLEPIGIIKIDGVEVQPFYFYEDVAYQNLCDKKCLVWPKSFYENLTKIN